MKKQTKIGIPRRIDKLGRVCLPIEVRNICGIAENDELEVFVDDGIIHMRKYIAKNYSLMSLLEKILQIMKTSTGLNYCIVDGTDVVLGSYSEKFNREKQGIIRRYNMIVNDEKEIENLWREGYYIGQVGQQMEIIAMGENIQEVLPQLQGYKSIIQEILNWASKEKE